MSSYTPQFLCNQAQRTEPTRRFLYSHVKWTAETLVLDLGCGTGTLTGELTRKGSQVTAIGLDIDPRLLTNALKNCPSCYSLHFLLADATTLPFRSSCFTFVLSHFTMMWLSNRTQSIKEIYRILGHSGVFAAIEPDYSGRIEAPHKSEKTSQSYDLPIIQYLQKMGADPFTGGHLPSELEQNQFHSIGFGILAWQFNRQIAQNEIKEEAALLKAEDLIWPQPDFTYTPIFWILAKKD